MEDFSAARSHTVKKYSTDIHNNLGTFYKNQLADVERNAKNLNDLMEKPFAIYGHDVKHIPGSYRRPGWGSPK